MDDSEQLIALNSSFRGEMMQWEADLGRTSPAYPVLDHEDLEYILNQEEDSVLVVLFRKEGLKDHLLGYAYAYIEPWTAVAGTKPRKGNGGRSRIQPSVANRQCKSEESDVQKSLYIAELYVTRSERGCGFGELLLWKTLKQDGIKNPSKRSHLYVSSRNVSALKIYQKFGYKRSHKSSGDDVHDVVMELEDTETSIIESAQRLEQRLESDPNCGRRARSRTSPVVPNGPASPTPPHQGHRCTPEPHGSPCQLSPTMTCSSLRFPPPQLGASRVPSNGQKRPAKPPSSRVNGSARCILKEDEGELILGDLFEMKTRNHGGYERKADPSAMIPISGKMLTADSSSRKKKELANSDAASSSNGPHVRSRSPIEGGHRHSDTMAHRPPQPWKFVLTGYPRVALQKRAEESIISLGGEVSRSDGYDPSCSHVVSPLPIKTEKFMCALASGKPLLHSAYIEHCAQQGRFLPLESFEWLSIAASSTGVDKLDASQFELSKALIAWSEHRHHDVHSESKARKRRAVADRSRGCFFNMSAVLFVSNSHSPSLGRLLEAGEASMCMDFRQLDHRTNRPKVTHAIVSMDIFDSELDASQNWGSEPVRQRALLRLRELEDEGVVCVRLDYVLDLLVKGPHLAAADYVVRVKDHHGGKKRKRDGIDQKLSVSPLFDAEPLRGKKSGAR